MMNTAPALQSFLTKEEAEEIRRRFGTPTYVYREDILEQNAKAVLAFPNAFGLTARYAMKANPNRTILEIFDRLGLHIDASTVYEAERAISVGGVNPKKIQLTSQVIHDEALLKELVRQGVLFNATSLHQLDIASRVMPGGEISIRINPGEGSGVYKSLTTGGEDSSFGIWHEQLLEAKRIVDNHGINVVGLHTHIGSGAKPEVWQATAALSLPLAKEFPNVIKFSLGGGFKTARMPDEKTTNLQVCGEQIVAEFEKFYKETGRKLHLEIEPGTYLVANAGVLLSTVMDVKRTTPGNDYVLVNAGMTEALRIPLYAAQHPLRIILADSGSRDEQDYVVCGPCCESTDVLTPVPKYLENPAVRTALESEGHTDLLEFQRTRRLTVAQIGDLLEVGGCGAYCESMSAIWYNSIPQAAAVLVRNDGNIVPIASRGNLSQLVSREMLPEGY